MKILWLSWKDMAHPQAGGAEVVKREITRRLVATGHEVILITAGFPGAEKETIIDGCTVIRVGGRYSVYWHAWRYYSDNLRGWADLVIDECNTVPFFARAYVAEPSAMVVYQLAREVWFYQMMPPFSWIGYCLEPLYMRLLSTNRVVTICGSTKCDLVELGFDLEKIHIIRMGSELACVPRLSISKPSDVPTMLYVGSLREMKRPDHVIAAYQIASKLLPELRLIIAGAGEDPYFTKLVRIVESSGLTERITFSGHVNKEEKLRLMQCADVIVVTSVKEGWGLIVTEAASQGTPAVVYDVDGLRDSVKHRETGLVTASTPEALAAGVVEMLTNPKFYTYCRQNAWEWSKELNFDNTYGDFCKALEIA